MCLLHAPPAQPASEMAISSSPPLLLPLISLLWTCSCNYSKDEDPVSPGSCSNYHYAVARESWSSGRLGLWESRRDVYQRGKGSRSPLGSPSPPPKWHFPYSEASLGTCLVQVLLARAMLSPRAPSSTQAASSMPCGVPMLPDLPVRWHRVCQHLTMHQY